MKNEDRTKEQLIDELTELRQRVAELETVKAGRKRADEALRASELRYRTTLDAMGDAIHLVDPDLRFTLLNPAYRQWAREFGSGTTNIIGRTIFEVFPSVPDGVRDRVRDEYDQVFRTGETLVTEESTTFGDREFITETRKIPVFEKGKIAQVVTVMRDITERKRMEEAMRRHGLEQKTLRQAALALTTALERDKVIDRILVQLQQVVPYDSSTVQLLRASPEPGRRACPEHSRRKYRLEIVGGRGFSNLPDLLRLSFPVDGDNPNSEVVRTRAPFIVADAPAVYDGFRKDPHQKTVIRSWLGVPMLVGERLVGMIALDRREPGFYTQEHARLAEVFAAQAAVAVENAHLFQAEREQRELAEALAEATAAVSSTLDLDQVLAAVLEQARRLLGVIACSVWLIDPQTDELVCQQAAGPQSEIVRGWRLPPGVGLAGWVARSGESLAVPDVKADARHFKGVDQQTGLPLRSILTFPLRVKESVIGVLEVVDGEVNRFGPADLELMEPLVASAAIAIENAQLYEQARQDAKTRSVLLREVNHRVKNNLTGIIGLLYTARDHARVEDRATYESTMDDLIGRVRGLATVHSLLSASEWMPLRLSDLAAQVIRAALQALPHHKHMSVAVSPSPVRVTSDQAHDLALVIHELATNVIKYALGERNTAQIAFQVAFDGSTVRCEFRDDGPGYSEDVLQLERYNVGFDLIQNIVRDSLHGELALHNDDGAVAIFQFKTRITEHAIRNTQRRDPR